MQTIEYRLVKVLEFLNESGRDCFFTSLSEANRQMQTADGPVFISVREKFNAPQFFGRALGVDSVNAEGYLLLEKGGTEDYCNGDDYYKQFNAVVKLSASINKMRDGGPLGVTSHEARLFCGFGGRHVPLGVFGTLTATPEFLQIKPFAIWK